MVKILCIFLADFIILLLINNANHTGKQPNILFTALIVLTTCTQKWNHWHQTNIYRVPQGLQGDSTEVFFVHLKLILLTKFLVSNDKNCFYLQIIYILKIWIVSLSQHPTTYYLHLKTDVSVVNTSRWFDSQSSVDFSEILQRKCPTALNVNLKRYRGVL